jgi:hypothetical protein
LSLVLQRTVRPLKILSSFLLSLFMLGVSLISPQEAYALYSWTQVNEDGFGDANNWGTIRLYVSGDYLYAGTGNNSGAQIHRTSDGTTWEAVTSDGFGDTENYEFHAFADLDGYLYASTLEAAAPANPTGAEIWRSQTGSAGSWVQVNTDGFGSADNTGARAMAVFGGYLYVGTDNDTTGSEVWRTSDGTTWEQINTDGFGDAVNSDSRALKVYNNYLYAGVYNGTAGGKLFRFPSDGDENSDWVEVVDDGFGDASNVVPLFLEEFDGYLYAGALNSDDGAELWRSASGDSGSWESVVTDGFGNNNNTWISYQGAVVNSVFWVGTRNGTDGAQLWYSTDGTSFTQEGSDGFGDANNYALYATEFGEMSPGRLYVGFSNSVGGTEIWRSEALAGLAITTSSPLPEATVGVSYNQTIEAVNGTSPYIFTYTGTLPPGLTLSSAGVLYGTPTGNSTYTFTITVTDSGTPAQTDSKEFQLTVNPGLPDTGVVGSSYNVAAVGWLLPLALIALRRFVRS